MLQLIELEIYHDQFTIYALDSSGGIWSRLPPIVGVSPSHSLTFTGVGRKLVVFGVIESISYAGAVFVFDFVSGNWHRGADEPGEPRTSMACAADTDRMLVCVAGGVSDKTGGSLRCAMAYDVKKDTWIEMPDMGRCRVHGVGRVHGGKFHVVGGYYSMSVYETSAEAFDIATWQWEQVVEDDVMLNPTKIPSNYNFVFSGNTRKMYKIDSENNQVLVRVEERKWKSLAHLPFDGRRVAISMVTLDSEDKVLLFMGYKPSFKYIGKCLHCIAYILMDKKKQGGGGERGYAWTQIELPEEYAKFFTRATCLQI